ncbi:MAG: NADH-quinone oxidoreductase subunit C [Pirellulales bacterium]
MSGPTVFDRLKETFGDKITGANLDAIDPWIEVAADAIVDVCVHLRDTPETRFDYLSSLSAVDYLETDPKKAAKVAWQPHLELVYHLWSVELRHSLVLKVMLPRWRDGQKGELPQAPTVSTVWRTADWHEREVYDLMGVEFTGHPNMRRILCPEDWVGHPLRKDYEMPAEYHGIRGR